MDEIRALSIVALLFVIGGCFSRQPAPTGNIKMEDILIAYHDGNFAACHILIDKYFQQNEIDTNILGVKAICLYNEGFYNEAQESCRIARGSKYLPDGTYLGMMGKINRQLKDYGKALTYYDSAVNLETGKVYLLDRSLIYSVLNEPEKGIADCDLLLRSDSTLWKGAIQNKGVIYRAWGKYDSAYYFFSYWHRTWGPSASSNFNLASVYYKLGKNDSSLLLFTRAIEMDGNNGLYYYERGILYYILKDKEKACKDWQKADELQYAKAKAILGDYCN